MTDAGSVNANLAGYCGLYCGACDVLRLYQDGVKAGRVPEWSELPEEFRKHAPVSPSPIRCHGCRSDDVFAGCARCPLRACAKRKAIEFCTQCQSYPCLRVRFFQLVAWLISFEKKLPHQKTKVPNLARIQCVGKAAWLDEQDKRWRCPECSAPYSWYARTCPSCQRELDFTERFGPGSR